MTTMQRNIGRITNGAIVWQYPDYRAIQIGQFEDGQFVVETIKKLGAPKTSRQLGYYYAVILPMIHHELNRLGFDVMGVPVTEEYVDKIVKSYCCQGELKRNMSKQECATFITNAISWANNHLKIEIPEPNERA